MAPGSVNLWDTSSVTPNEDEAVSLIFMSTLSRAVGARRVKPGAVTKTPS